MDISSSNRNAAIKELIKGREFALQLSTLWRKVRPGDSSVAGGLAEELVCSFSRAIDALGSIKSTDADENSGGDVVSVDDEVKNENGGKKRKNNGDGRGGCRKRKHSSQWRTIISKTINDEYAWRKYGQKEIHSSKFPRSYFRCTHKYDQGCQATKQVQKSEEDPSLYIITYMGQHLCTNLGAMPSLIMATNSSEPSMISFGSNTSNVTQDYSLPSSSLVSRRQEGDDEALSNLTPSMPSSEFFNLPDIEPLVSSEPALQNRGEGSSLDMSFLLDSFNFRDHEAFSFEHGDLFSEWRH